MGLGGISFWQLLILFGIVILVFGTHRLKHLGRDLGDAIKSFRSSMQEKESNEVLQTAPIKKEKSSSVSKKLAK